MHAKKIDELGSQYLKLAGKYRLTQRPKGASKLKPLLMKYN